MKSSSSSIALALSASFLVAMSACGQESVRAASSDQDVTARIQVAPEPSDQILQLVAPIALYPDPLLAEILTATTHPAEVAEASRWVQQHSALRGQPREDAMNAQPWDASVKGLAQFPSVLDNLNENFSWTTALGDVYADEPDEVMSAIQILRERAQSAGTLNSTSEEVVTADDQTIVIEPASPDVVDVPAYDPWLVYGSPLEPYPGWIDAPDVFYAGPNVGFGVGLGDDAFATFPWAWQDWSFDWRHRAVLHDRAPYVPHSPLLGEGHEGPDARPHIGEHAGMSIDHDNLERLGSPFEHGLAPQVAPFADPRAFEHGRMMGGQSTNAPIGSSLTTGGVDSNAFAERSREGELHAGGFDEGGLHSDGSRGGGSHR